MIEEKMEILLITYNRAKDLDNTLKQLLKSPFSKFKISILDNCSTDETPEICAKYVKLFSNMKIIRYNKNIGGNANFLRAVETSKSYYTWILCDDDNYDFSECQDIMRAIESEKYDIISVGAPGQYHWERGLETTSQELIKMGSKYYHVFTFVSGFIFKTNLFDSYCMYAGYINICNVYPHFPFINKSVEENFSIYVSKKELIIRGIHNESGFSGLFWLKSWLNSCTMIKDKKIRRKTIYESTTKGSFIGRITYAIFMYKIANNSSMELIDFLAAFIKSFWVSKDLLLLIIIIPLIIIPKFIYRFIKAHVFKRKTFKMLENNNDPFRGS